ncbi:hypothetical protein Acr_26g0011690 [Actinidia rufa]|uniref:Uncharacterized protein n=1 Tax=Actinidia rufa TaxID=165716 RepID=A0A7J0H464_9ERIC|nr:hypothetical protein Acr_26g0011690 [Actinidia rufa]
MVTAEDSESGTCDVASRCKAQAEDVSECVIVCAVNMDWHQCVAGQSGRQRFMGMNQFVGGLVRTQDWHWHGLGNSHVEGCNHRQLLDSSWQFHSVERGIVSEDTCMCRKYSRDTCPKAGMDSCWLVLVADLN